MYLICTFIALLINYFSFKKKKNGIIRIKNENNDDNNRSYNNNCNNANNNYTYINNNYNYNNNNDSYDKKKNDNKEINKNQISKINIKFS